MEVTFTASLLNGLGLDVIGAWVSRVFDDADCFVALPDEARNEAWIKELADRIHKGSTMAAITGYGKVARGLFFADLGPCGIAYVHQFVVASGRRGFMPVKMARAAMRLFWSQAPPSYTHAVGITPEDFRAAIVCAERAGFKRCGTMPTYYKHNGELLDCAILVARKPEHG